MYLIVAFDSRRRALEKSLSYQWQAPNLIPWKQLRFGEGSNRLLKKTVVELADHNMISKDDNLKARP